MVRIRLDKASLALLKKNAKRKVELVSDNSRKAMRTTAKAFKRKMRSRASRGPLFKESGRLRDSIRSRVSGGKTTAKLRIFSISEYANTHEFGRTITTKRARALTIPYQDNLRRIGLPGRTKARDLLSNPNVDTYTTSPVSGNNMGYIMYRSRGIGADFPLFALRSRVYVPPRLGWFATWKKMYRGLKKGLVRAQRSGLAGKSI